MAGVIALSAVTVLSGCVSTQTKNARTLLINQRTIDAEQSVRVKHADPEISVTSVRLIRADHGTAVVVRLRNDAKTAVSDLPISVGVGSGRARRYLNGAANLPYFSTHIASIGPGQSSLWVLGSVPAPPAHARPFGLVGAATDPVSIHSGSVPQLRVTAGAAAAGGILRAVVSNPTGVPQYGLQVYAVGTRDGRTVAAGSYTIAGLAGGAHDTALVHVTGATTGADFQLLAPATIFK
jgi:hypothetical protein